MHDDQDQCRSQHHDHHPVITHGLNDISSFWKSENTHKRFPTKISLTSWSSTTTPPQPQKDNPNVKNLEDNMNNIDSTTNAVTNQIRVCSDCNTTKTPLWRSGPRGPKSLCNACGIRQRKARRRAMTAAAAANHVSSDKSTKIITKVQNKEKTRHDQYLLPYNKRFRDHDIHYNNNNDHHGINKDGRFEDFFISLSKKLAYHRVFPKDEEEAAILLMAISSGLVHG